LSERVACLAGCLLLGLASLACGDRDDRESRRDRISAWERAVADTGPRPPVEGRGDNVVLIIVDTLRADKLGCYGFPLDTSPELDRLAAKSVRFERVIAQCSWTRPSIGSLLTGHYPRTLGLYRGRHEILDDRFDTLAEVLERSGYTTIGITANPQISGRLGFGQGFDLYADSPRDLPRRPGKRERRERRRHEFMRKGPTRYNKFPSKFVFDSVLDLVDRLPRGPHYVQIDVMEVHRRGPRVRPEFGAGFGDQRERRYLRAVRQISHDVGRFVEQLLARPGWEQTLVILASDHGEGLTDHPGIKDGHRHGFLLYESQLWVPLVVLHTGGGVTPGTVERPVRNMDLMPTVLDFLELPIPDGVEGRSVAPLLVDRGGAVELPEHFVAETYRPKAAKIAVYDAEWKYFENRDDWPQLGARELQAMGQREVGPFTDRIDLNAEVSWELDASLEQWERGHPKADPTYRGRRLPGGLADRLKGLGYLGDEDAGESDSHPGPP
jgi:arylsulfatase A-like enzyme